MQNSEQNINLHKFVDELSSDISACSDARTRHNCTAVHANATARDGGDGHVCETLYRTDYMHAVWPSLAGELCECAQSDSACTQTPNHSADRQSLLSNGASLDDVAHSTRRSRKYHI